MEGILCGRFSKIARNIEDLMAGITVAGVVTNATHDGAFVDIGVHQDNFHISHFSNAPPPQRSNIGGNCV